MNWPTYAQYRAVETQWLGQVPDHWATRSPKTLFALHREPAHPEDRQLTASQSDGVVYQDEYMEARGARVVQVIEGQAGLKHVAAGDFVISLRSFQGGIEYSPVAGKISPAYTILTPGHEVVHGYFVHLLKSGGFVQELRSTSNQLRDGQSLGLEHFAQVRVPVPPHSEQVAIADFLDCETARIDALIGKQEQLIATLREDRAATVTQAVTKGLDPDAEMKDSGDLASPVHWKQVPLKRVASVQTGLTLGRTVDPEAAVSLPYLRVANVQAGQVDLSHITTVEIDQSEVARYLLRPGDVLMTEGGDIDKLGRGCMWQGEIDPCLHQNHVFSVRCSSTLDARFLVYLLDTMPARNYFMLTAKKTTNLASTNSTTLGRFTFALPSAAEQASIVSFLDDRCGKIDALIDKSTEMIETLREYRSAMITDAVTGKIDVRGAA